MTIDDKNGLFSSGKDESNRLQEPEEPQIIPADDFVVNQNTSEKIFSAEQQEVSNREPEGEASMFSTVANVANAAVGAGILAIPYAFMNAGLVAGMLICISTSLLTAYCLRMLIFCIDKSNKFTYEQVIQFAFGKWIGYLMRGIMVFTTAGSQTIYVVVIADTLHPILSPIIKAKGVHWIFYDKIC